MASIFFNYPHITGKESDYINEVLAERHLCGDGKFSRLCHQWLEETLGCPKALLTPSGTAALEMAALLLDIGPEDEVIMPSFTFVSTANAFVLRGAKVVFVDINPETLCIEPSEIEKAIGKKTRAVVPVHYGGIGCEMHAITRICRDASISIVEDAAHAIQSKYDRKPLGTFGSLSAFSFHETKNLVAGEAGALIINDETLIERAEIIREKGTDRSRFFRGQIDKYTWQDIGSSYLPSELQAAFLWAQIEHSDFILSRRQWAWQNYHSLLEPLEKAGLLRRPVVPEYAMQNGHLYYILLPDRQTRDELMAFLHSRDIGAVFHYIPLHDSPAGKRYGRSVGQLSVTSDVSGRLLRLPLSVSLTIEQIEFVAASVGEFFKVNKIEQPRKPLFDSAKSS